jgi:hypothetical protein
MRYFKNYTVDYVPNTWYNRAEKKFEHQDYIRFSVYYSIAPKRLKYIKRNVIKHGLGMLFMDDKTLILFFKANTFAYCQAIDSIMRKYKPRKVIIRED